MLARISPFLLFVLFLCVSLSLCRMGNTYAIAVLTLANGAAPLSTTRLQINATTQFPAAPKVSQLNVTCASINAASYPSELSVNPLFRSLSFNPTVQDVPVTQFFDFGTLSVATEVQCTLTSSNALTGDPEGDHLTYAGAYDRYEFGGNALVLSSFRIGAPAGGAGKSLVVGPDTEIDSIDDLPSTAGYSFEAWYRCSIAPTSHGTTSAMAQNPGGVFFSRTQFGAEGTNTSLEFSHTPTRLCGTATRFIPGAGTGDAYAVAYCTVEYPSTMGQWVHGAMTWNATTGVMTFYLNGVKQTISGPQQTFAYDAFATTGNTYGDVDVLVYSGDSTTYLTEGTALDNLRAWSVERTEAQMQASYNKPLMGNEVGLVTYFTFHGDGTDAKPYYNRTYPVNGVATTETWPLYSISATPARFIYPTAQTPSCLLPGCGAVGTDGSIPSGSGAVSSSAGSLSSSAAAGGNFTSTGAAGTNTAPSSSARFDGAASASASASLAGVIALTAALVAALRA